MSDFLDGLGVPHGWQPYLASFGAMLALAGLDFVGAIFAKEWAERHHTVLFLAGMATFGVLFAVYARILEVAELSIVTLGWVVFLQVGLLVVDRLVYGVTLPTSKWLAVGLILVLQGYLILGPNAATGDAPESHDGHERGQLPCMPCEES